MNDSQMRFYNMLLHLVRNNRIYEENAAIRNVWEKDGNTFFDIYFYRRRKSYIFDGVFIHDILDLSNEKYYKDVEAFVKDFKNAETLNPPQPETKQYASAVKLFEPLETDLELLHFIAVCGTGILLPVKEKIIIEYIKSKIPEAENLSYQYISCFLKDRKHNEKNFYAALDSMKRKSPQEAEKLFHELLKIALSDGRLHYHEKWYIAEVWEQLRRDGLVIKSVI